MCKEVMEEEKYRIRVKKKEKGCFDLLKQVKLYFIFFWAMRHTLCWKSYIYYSINIQILTEFSLVQGHKWDLAMHKLTSVVIAHLTRLLTKCLKRTHYHSFLRHFIFYK